MIYENVLCRIKLIRESWWENFIYFKSENKVNFWISIEIVSEIYKCMNWTSKCWKKQRERFILNMKNDFKFYFLKCAN